MASVHEQRLQFAQRRHAHNRLVGLVHVAAGPGVEHPHWDLDRMGVEIRRQTTANDTLILERPRAMDPDGATEPRMPAIAHLQRLGTMGVPLLACTTRNAGTRRLGTCRQANSSGAGAPRSKSELRHSTHGEQRVDHRRPVRFVASDRTARPWTTLPADRGVRDSGSGSGPPECLDPMHPRVWLLSDHLARGHAGSRDRRCRKSLTSG